jgi:glyoxylase-like metal-dependent hydrolase (beta-lactamase superfamily II)
MEIINVGDRITNDYIYAVKGGYVLVDTGYEKEYENFCEKLQKNMIEQKDIAYIFITHSHDDHIGFLNELLHHNNAKVILHSKAAMEIQKGQITFTGGCSNYIARMVFRNMAKKGHWFTPVEKEFKDRLIIINDDNKSDLEKKLDAKIIETPGHTGCSVSLLRSDGKLFCGDAAMSSFPSFKRAAIWIDYLDEFCESWNKIIELKPKKIYPGHGKPFPVSDLEKYLPRVQKLKLLPL